MNNLGNAGQCKSWKWIGVAAAIATAWMIISMLPDMKRYMKIESM